MSNNHDNLTPREQAALDIIARHTPAKPVTIGTLQLLLVQAGYRKPDARAVKGIIATLRLAGHPIGASRGKLDDAGKPTEAPGYFFCRTEAEKRRALAEYKKQAVTMLVTMRAFSRGVMDEARLAAAGEQLSLLDI